MPANQDRIRLACVLETLARVLRSEAEDSYELGCLLYESLMPSMRSIRVSEPFLKVHDVERAEDYATKAAKLAGVEAVKAVGDG